MTLTELARTAGIPARTVRYYADRGLIRPARRSAGGYRLFDDRAMRQLRFVRRLQGLGLTLGKLQRVLRAAERQSCGERSTAIEQLLAAQLSSVEHRLEELSQVHHELASLLGREREGCSDELCLCDGSQMMRFEARPARRGA